MVFKSSTGSSGSIARTVFLSREASASGGRQCGAHDNRDRVRGIIHVRKINHSLRVFIGKIVLLHAADHPDNRARFVLGKCRAIHEPMSEGAFVGPIASGEILVDHADLLFPVVVGILEIAPRDERNTETLPVITDGGGGIMRANGIARCQLDAFHGRGVVVYVARKR